MLFSREKNRVYIILGLLLAFSIYNYGQKIEFYSFGNGYDYELETAEQAYKCIYQRCFDQLRRTKFINDRTYVDSELNKFLEEFSLSNDKYDIRMNKARGTYSSTNIRPLQFYGVFKDKAEDRILFQVMLQLSYQEGGLLIADSIKLLTSSPVLEIDNFHYVYEYSNGSKTNFPLPPPPPPRPNVEVIGSMAFSLYEGRRINLCNSCQVKQISVDNQKGYYLLKEKYAYDYIRYLNSSRYLVQGSGKYGVVDDYNEIITPLIFDEIIVKTNSTLKVRIDSLYGVYDLAGKELLPVEYEEIEIRSVFKNKNILNLFIVRQGGNCGVMDDSSKNIIPIEYDSIQLFYSKYFRVKKNHRFGIYSVDGEVLLQTNYQKIDFESSLFSNRWYNVVDNEGNYEVVRILEKDGEELIERMIVKDP